MRERVLTTSLLDRDLVASARSGSLDAFDVIVDRHQARVFRLACNMLGNPDDARDIQQETFIRAWKSLGSLKDPANLGSWLHRIVVNLCLSYKRREKPVVELPDIAADGCIQRQFGQSAIADATIRTIYNLPLNHRTMLVLRILEEKSFEEIALILNCSENSARSRFFNATRLLRERMRPWTEELDND